MANHNHNDRGFRGTKFILAVIAMSLCVITFAATGIWPELGAQYGTLVSAVDAIAALYMGGNAASQWVAAKHGPKDAPVVGQPEENEPAPRAK